MIKKLSLGIMQPYFFPYIGYFQLLNTVDHWIAFDDIQFIDKGWINRNRVLHPDIAKEWQYITLPLSKRGQFDKIRDIEIDTRRDWRAQILGKLTSYKKKAPYYLQTIKFLERTLSSTETNLSNFVIKTLKTTADYIGIHTPISVQSEMDLKLGEIAHPGQWALEISKSLGATEYVNPLGGAGIFQEREFVQAGISLSFLEPVIENYSQKRERFVPGLSIIDVMMWNSKDAIKAHVNKATKLSAGAEFKGV